MIKNLVKSYSGHFVSRWTVLLFDLIIVASAFVGSYLLLFTFNYIDINRYEAFVLLGITLPVYLLSFLITRSYTGVLRHTGLDDGYRILAAGGIALITLVIINLIKSSIGSGEILILPYPFLFLHFLLTVFLLVGARLFVKQVFHTIVHQFDKERIPVVIYGAGEAGILTKSALSRDKVHRYEIIAFIDDNPTKINKRIEGTPVLTQDRVMRESYIKRYGIRQLIISIQGIDPDKKKKIVELGLDLNLHVKVVPGIELWINGELSSKQLRRVKIEELLERDPIKLDSSNITRELKDKIVMVTGGAGSIGCEIVRQVLSYSPSRVIVIDQAETGIYDLQFEINSNEVFKKRLGRIEFVVANVKDKFRMDQIFDTYRPNIIYHAAAYKHVPLMEQNPYEALAVNVFGTKIIADLAIKYKADKFVMVSTDKAVNPTNIMGASKRIAEIYIQGLRKKKTKFVTTRFGNVLGSNGSVVPLFRKQIEAGGPITLTHKEITRYFMTIPEACNLVLEAGAMGNGADIFVFDMGDPVRLLDMAKKMIRLYGYSEDEIKIVETGLRPGEKLYEELLATAENTLPTHHPKILRAKVSALPNGDAVHYIDALSELIVEADVFALVAKMKEIVPEYVSNNSVFQKLDK